MNNFDFYDDHCAVYYQNEEAYKRFSDAIIQGTPVIFEKEKDLQELLKDPFRTYQEFLDNQRMMLYYQLRGALSASTHWKKVVLLVHTLSDPRSIEEVNIVESVNMHYHQSTESQYFDCQSKQYFLLFNLEASVPDKENKTVTDFVNLYIIPYSDKVQGHYMKKIRERRSRKSSSPKT